jgi:ribosomal protein S20
VANHPSALKRHRQSVKRHTRNQVIKTRVRNLVRPTPRRVTRTVRGERRKRQNSDTA